MAEAPEHGASGHHLAVHATVRERCYSTTRGEDECYTKLRHVCCVVVNIDTYIVTTLFEYFFVKCKNCIALFLGSASDPGNEPREV